MNIPHEKQDMGQMRAMFDTIAPRYDFITRIFSYGMDLGWKREAVRLAGLPGAGARVLDLACGTGDFSRLVAPARAVAADLTLRMLTEARELGVERCVCADATNLPFADGSFDAVFAGYGMRNFPDLPAALREIHRVLRSGGRLATLDFYLPANPVWRVLFLGYLYVQGAFWGLLLHGKPRIYTYIPDSVRSFLTTGQFAEALAGAGFGNVTLRSYLLGGIAVQTIRTTHRTDGLVSASLPRQAVHVWARASKQIP